MTVRQQQEHGKDGAGHVARIAGALQRLPGSGLQPAGLPDSTG